eukprot:PhM_4_TR5416/c0_g1_i1/m.14290
MADPKPRKVDLDDDDPVKRVYLGLQRKRRCALCQQDFYVEALPGAITHKSILKLKMKWGLDVTRQGRMPSPSLLYKREELCVFCMQFFDVDESGGSDDGMGSQQMNSTSGGMTNTMRSKAS